MLYPTELWAHRQAVQAVKNIRAYPVQSQRDSRLGRTTAFVVDGLHQCPHIGDGVRDAGAAASD